MQVFTLDPVGDFVRQYDVRTERLLVAFLRKLPFEVGTRHRLLERLLGFLRFIALLADNIRVALPMFR